MNWPFKFQVTWHGILRKEMRHCTLSCRFFILLIVKFNFADVADLYSLHSRTGHYDLFGWTDPQQNTDAQRRFRPTHRAGVCFRRAAPAPGDGRHRDRAPQRHLPHLRRYCCRSVFYLLLLQLLAGRNSIDLR